MLISRIKKQVSKAWGNSIVFFSWYFFLTEPSKGADVALVIDYGTTPEIARLVSNFTNTLIDGLGISPRGVHVGVIMYAINASIVIPFNAFKEPSMTLDAVKGLIEKATTMPGKSRIDKALEIADKKLFTIEGGARPGIPRVREFWFKVALAIASKVYVTVTYCLQFLILVATDTSKESDQKPLIEVSSGLKDKDVKVYAVGIMPNVTQEDLEDTTFKPNVYIIEPDQLSNTAKRIKDVVNGYVDSPSSQSGESP